MKLGIYTAGCILFAHMGAVHGLKLSDYIDFQLAGIQSLAQSQSSDFAALVADTHKKGDEKVSMKPKKSDSIKAEPSTEDKFAADIAKTFEDTVIGMQHLVKESKEEADKKTKEDALIKTVEDKATKSMSSGKKETSGSNAKKTTTQSKDKKSKTGAQK